MTVMEKIFMLFIKLSKILSRKGLYPFLNAQFFEIQKDLKVLNIGVGGEISKLLNTYAAKNNFKVVSFDISEQRNPDILGDICSYDFNGEKFDIVVIAEVLEHLHSPHLAIQNIFSILKDEGKLILTVPFIFPIHERPFDYYRYTRYGLEFLLKDFKYVSIKERNSWAEAINTLSVRLIMDPKISSKIFAPLFIVLAFFNLPFVVLLSWLIKSDFITSGYLVSARK